MNDPKAKKGTAVQAPVDPGRLDAITENVSAEHGIDPASGPLPEGESLDGQASPDSRPALLDPAVCRKIARRSLGMVERAASRDLFSTALRATGDKAFAAEVVAGWAWSEQDMEEVADLVFETAKLYAADRFFRPDIALLVSVGMHGLGFLVVKRSIAERVKETGELEAAARLKAEQERKDAKPE